MARERTSRDFVPWRFSDAGYRSAWLDRRRRRPKTCTITCTIPAHNLHTAHNRTRADAAKKLLDNLVRTGEQCRWHFKAEYLGGLQVDDELIFGRRLHREVPRLCALENSINIPRCVPDLVKKIRPVGHQAVGGDPKAAIVDRG